MASAAMFGAQGLTSILGGMLGSKGANEALKAIQQGKMDSSALNYYLYNQQRKDQQPFASAGTNAVNMLQYMLGLGGGPGGRGDTSGAGDSSKMLNGSPTASAMAGMDGKNGTIKANGSGFSWIPGSGNARGYTFMYNDGKNDVYQRSSGGPGTGINIDYAVVGPDHQVNFTAQPPIANQFSSQGSQGAPAGSGNDPNYGSLMHDFGSSDFQTDPGYNFRLSEGAKALQRSAAAKGGLYSGGTMKDLTNYNQNFASNEYQNAYNRFQTNRATKYNQLASLAGMGQVAVGQVGNDTNQLAGNLTGITQNSAAQEANARASSYTSWANGLTGAANAGLNWYQMSKMNGGSGGGGGGGNSGGGINWNGGPGQYNPVTGTYNP